ncbi:MAG: DNA polymerase III subunit gamma/tau, partial [Paracoccaceae bacterium]
LSRFARFEDVVELIRHNRDVKLLVEVETTLRLARYAPGRIEFVPCDNAPPDLAMRLAQRLRGWTGVRWGVTLVNEGGGETIAEMRDTTKRREKDQLRDHPLVAAVFAAFPGAGITDIREPADIDADTDDVAPDDTTDDDWDPFEAD